MDSSNDEKIMQNEEEQNEIVQETKFINGSKYEGTWNAIDKTGIGRYIMPHGVILDGEYRNSMPHGHGSIFWPRGQIMDATWNRGYIEEKRYIFADGLSYHEEKWNYCKFPDRRFYYCILNGLNPANKVLRTNDQPTKMIPSSCYDTVDGFFDSKKESIISYNDYKKVKISFD